MKKIIKLEADDHVVIEKDKIIITKENTATENSDVRYCHMCGASAKKHHTFCIKCGTKLINRNIR